MRSYVSFFGYLYIPGGNFMEWKFWLVIGQLHLFIALLCHTVHNSTVTFTKLYKLSVNAAVVHCRGTPWHRPCSPLSHSQFFDVAWKLTCSHAPSQTDYISVCSIASWLSLQPWSRLEYNVVMTFRFNNNNNNCRAICETVHLQYAHVDNTMTAACWNYTTKLYIIMCDIWCHL